MMSEENRQLMMSGQGSAALQMWKDSYYGKTGVGADRRRLVDAYLHGIHWVLEYYYRGVASWNWCALPPLHHPVTRHSSPRRPITISKHTKRERKCRTVFQ